MDIGNVPVPNWQIHPQPNLYIRLKWEVTSEEKQGPSSRTVEDVQKQIHVALHSPHILALMKN